MSATAKPAALFVCVKNGGKSQMAAGLMKARAGGQIEVSSAGTQPGSKINALSAAVLLEQGIDITTEHPKQLTEDAMRQAGLVVVLGREAQVPPTDGVEIEVWELDEPSSRGIDGRERMLLVRDEISRRVADLASRLLSPKN